MEKENSARSKGNAKLSLAREIAYDAFIDVMERKKKPEESLQALFDKNSPQLTRLDRNFAKEILYGGLRWYSKIYWILQNTSKRNLNETPPEMRASLILGTYQIFYMDRVPDRASVNESVEYLRKKGLAHATSFGNGILRQIARRAAYFAKPDKEKSPEEYLALQYAHPRWMVDRWSRRFNFERMEALLSQNNQPPPYSVRINTLKTPTERSGELQDSLLREERTHSERRNLRTALRLKEAPDFSEDSLFQQGYYTMQDEASQLIAMLVAPEPGQRIVDCCAGPGGKLSHIYEVARGQAEIFAVERSKAQFIKAQNGMQRMGHTENIHWFQEDFLQWTIPGDKKAHKILLDAPCSGLGVLRRHPEGKWHKNEESIAVLAGKQRELILHALRLLEIGGELIFSVCSFEPEESENHLDFLQENFGEYLELISPVSRLPDYFKKYVTRNNLLSVYSGNQDEMDGFSAFIVALRKELSKA